jgi:hypothetical protein
VVHLITLDLHHRAKRFQQSVHCIQFSQRGFTHRHDISFKRAWVRLILRSLIIFSRRISSPLPVHLVAPPDGSTWSQDCNRYCLHKTLAYLFSTPVLIWFSRYFSFLFSFFCSYESVEVLLYSHVVNPEKTKKEIPLLAQCWCLRSRGAVFGLFSHR